MEWDWLDGVGFFGFFGFFFIVFLWLVEDENVAGNKV
jgi:hypothetical protein